MNVPKLRFKDFDGEWEEKKLIEVANVTMGQSPKGESYTTNPNDTILIQGNADIINEKVVPRIYTNAPTKMCEIGDVILSVRAPVGEIGISQYRACLGRGVCSINSKNHFIYHVLSKFRDTGFWKRKSQGSTFESINGDDIKGVLIHIPTISEQNKISTFFDMINKKIQLQQEKMDLLKEQKKGYMQKIFTQELRFKNNAGQDFPEWRKVHLKNVASIYDGTHQTPNYQTKGVKFLSVENIYDLKTSKYISKEDYDQEFKVRPEYNDILMTRIGDIGTANLIGDNDAYAYYVSLALIKCENVNPSYLVQEISNVQFQKELHRRTLHVAFPKKINKGEIGECLINLPSPMEQEKISLLFSYIDKKIKYESNKLNQLQLQKQAFMQQMFI